MLFCYKCEISKKIYFEKYLRTAASEDLSGAATLIFRRYFGSSSLSAFYKVSVLKTSVKILGKHICWSLFSIISQTFSPKFYWMKDFITDIFQWKSFILKTTFWQDISGRLLLMLRKLDIQTFNSKYLNSNPNSNNSILINIVGTLFDE